MCFYLNSPLLFQGKKKHKRKGKDSHFINQLCPLHQCRISQLHDSVISSLLVFLTFWKSIKFLEQKKRPEKNVYFVFFKVICLFPMTRQRGRDFKKRKVIKDQHRATQRANGLLKMQRESPILDSTAFSGDQGLPFLMKIFVLSLLFLPGLMQSCPRLNSILVAYKI